MTSTRLTLKEAAARLGVHYMTVYRYVRLGILPARKEGTTWIVESADLELLEEGGPSGAGGGRSSADWKARLQSRLIAGDAAGAWGSVEAALTAGVDPAGVYESMLAPAMRDIGELWAAGELDVADEHRASAVAGRLVGRLGPRFARRGRSKGTVVTAAPAGDHHGLALAVVGDLFRHAGYDVVDLGGDCPPESLRKAAAEAARLAAVAISAHRPGSDAEIRDAVAAARAAGAPLVLVGGSAVTGEEHARRLGADAWAETGSDGAGLLAGREAPA